MKRKELKVYHKKKAGRQERFTESLTPSCERSGLSGPDSYCPNSTINPQSKKSRYRLNNAKTKEKGILEHKEASIHGTYSAKDLHIAFPANFAMQEDYLDNVN